MAWGTHGDVTRLTTGPGGGDKPSTDLLRNMLRTQQRDCANLHSNPLFREFRAQAPKKRVGKGYAAQDAPAPVIEDLETEGKMRTLDLIKRAAERKNKEKTGVWAAFGKRYECLGEPVHLDDKLPVLNLHIMKGLINPDGTKRDPRGKMTREKSITLRTISRLSAKKELTQEEIERDKLLAHQTDMKFSHLERLEARFAEHPILRASDRLARAKTIAGYFVNEVEAEDEALEPEAVGIYPELAPIPRAPERAEGSTTGERSDGAELSLSKRPDDMTSSTPAGGRGGDSTTPGPSKSASVSPSAPPWLALGSTSEVERAGAPSTDLYYQPLTAPVRPALGDEDNRVYEWHNRFVAVRQKGRSQMQRMLAERAAGRLRTRGSVALAAGFYASIAAEMEYSMGARGSPLGKEPSDIWKKAELFAHPGSGDKARRRVAAHPVDLEDIILIERFYDQLCLLVEEQRASDPQSLLIVQTVKGLLEGGATLHAPLLAGAIESLAGFAKGAGLVRYNQYMLPILTFIRKCCGVSDVDMDGMLENAGIIDVVYSEAAPPATPLRTEPQRPSSRQPNGMPGGSRPASRLSPQRSGSRMAGGGLRSPTRVRRGSVNSSQAGSRPSSRASQAGSRQASRQGSRVPSRQGKPRGSSRLSSAQGTRPVTQTQTAQAPLLE